jgi:two-component system chemotaxis response regulator CheY
LTFPDHLLGLPGAGPCGTLPRTGHLPESLWDPVPSGRKFLPSARLRETPEAGEALSGVASRRCGHEGTDTQGLRVLIAEDHEPTAHLLKRAMERMDHHVLVASNGEQAWSLLQHEHVPLVVSDWMMPGLDGPSLCRRIRGRVDKRYTYIVLVTSRVSDEDRLAGLDAGADDFLSKPVDIRELNARLKIAGRILAMQQELERKNDELLELATTDPLTGLRNRRGFVEALDAQVAHAKRQGTPLSLILLDIDQFKAFNDVFGHPMGDGVIRAVAWVLRENARGSDVVARHGGEEFAVLLPETTLSEAVTVAERLRSAIQAANWRFRPVTASFGVSALHPACPGAAALVQEADRQLYRSKHKGRNQVSVDGQALAGSRLR